MITFKQFITEIGTTKVPYEVLRRGDHAFGTEAKIGDRFIRFTAIEDDTGEKPIWEIVFSEVTKGEYGHVDRNYRATGSGKAFEVASFVRDSFKDFLDHYEPESFYFTAEKGDDGDDTRQKIYLKLLKPLLKNYDQDTDYTAKDPEMFLFSKSN